MGQLLVGVGNFMPDNHIQRTVKPPRPPGRGFASRAYAPGKEDCHFCIAPLDPAPPDGACGEQAGQPGHHALRLAAPDSRRYVKERGIICLSI
jgi:hypothetical protein